METKQHRKHRKSRKYRNTFTGDRENRLTGRETFDRGQVNQVLKAIGREARQAHGEGDLQALHDRLEDAAWYRQELGIRVPDMI